MTDYSTLFEVHKYLLNELPIFEYILPDSETFVEL